MRTVALLALLTLTSAATAHADARAPTNCPEAMRVSEAAGRLLAEQRFDQAMTAYRSAYAACSARTFRAVTVFNLGLAHQGRADAVHVAEATDVATALAARRAALADRRAAAARFRDFLRWIPDGRAAAQARAYVANLEVDIELGKRVIAAMRVQRDRARTVAATL